MQYSKHKWKISQPESIISWLLVLTVEVGLFFLLTSPVLFFKRYKKVIFFILTFFYFLYLFDYITWFTIDRTFNINDIGRGIEFLFYYPEFMGKMSTFFLFKISIFIVLPVFLFYFFHKNFFNISFKYFSYLFLSIFCFTVIITPFLFKSGYYRFNTIFMITNDSIYEERLSRFKIDEEYISQLFGREKRDLENVARFKNKIVSKNIILYIIETAPKNYYPDFLEYLTDNGLSDLKNNSITSHEHYSTYPESDRAVYSILSGAYPHLERGTKWINKSKYENALPNIIKNVGYDTHIVSTAPLDFNDNIILMEKLGFDSITEVDSTKSALTINEKGRVWDRPLVYKSDNDLLLAAKALINKYKDIEAPPYLMVLLPQSSHAPFQIPPDFEPNTKSTDVDLIEANALWQYGVVKKIIKELEITNQLEDTILVLTGDHGIRSLYESEQLFSNPHLLDQVTFKVPFYIIDPSLKESVTLSNASSHIDIVPTILDMLGIIYNPNDYHGRNLFSNNKRTIYFLGGDYLPVDGFKKDGKFFMENRHRNLLLVNDSFYFKAKELDNEHHKINYGEDEKIVNDAILTIKSMLLKNN